MPKKYYEAEEIINILRQIEILVSHIVPMSFGKDKQRRCGCRAKDHRDAGPC